MISDAFTITSRGPAVIGQIKTGRIRVGDGFEEDAPHRRQGTVLAIEGVRKADDPDAVGLIVDLELLPGTEIVQLRPEHGG